MFLFIDLVEKGLTHGMNSTIFHNVCVCVGYRFIQSLYKISYRGISKCYFYRIIFSTLQDVFYLDKQKQIGSCKC